MRARVIIEKAGDCPAPLHPEPRLVISAFSRSALRMAGPLAVMAALAAPSSARRSAATLPLAAPVLQSFSGKSHTDSYQLKGDVDSVRTRSWVRILRNGVVVDSISTAKSKSFSVRVALGIGDNTLTAVLRDSLFNTSPPSNAVMVHFDDRPGFFMPVPFVPGASFDLNPVETAAKAEVRIFDTQGALVMRFENREPRAFYSFPWDGKNASFQRVLRGPLVAVGAIDYPDGTHDVIRQVFLFDPEGGR